MRHHHYHHHRRHRRHRRHSRFSTFWYWATGAAIIEGVFWVTIPGAIAVWWLLWLTAYVAMITARAMWQATQPADSSEPRWQQALDATRPTWPKRGLSRSAAVARRYRDHP